MARKLACLCDEATAETLDTLTKSQAIDLAIRLIRKYSGQDTLDGAALCEAVAAEMGPIYAARKDRPDDLAGRYPKMMKAAAQRARTRAANAAQRRAEMAIFDGYRGGGARGFATATA